MMTEIRAAEELTGKTIKSCVLSDDGTIETLTITFEDGTKLKAFPEVYGHEWDFAGLELEVEQVTEPPRPEPAQEELF